jgi:hypothetical protein
MQGKARTHAQHGLELETKCRGSCWFYNIAFQRKLAKKNIQQHVRIPLHALRLLSITEGKGEGRNKAFVAVQHIVIDCE